MIAGPTMFRKDKTLRIWLVDSNGNVAMSPPGLALLDRIRKLRVPSFSSTEQATAWGSRLNSGQHETLLDIQRTSSSAALSEGDLQCMVDMATESQLLREAAEAFVPGFSDETGLPMHIGGATCGNASRQN
jgi:hypothetical protein